MSISDRIPITSYQRLVRHVLMAAVHDVLRVPTSVGRPDNVAQSNSSIDAARWLMSTLGQETEGNVFRLTCCDVCNFLDVDPRIVRKNIIRELLKAGIDILEVADRRHEVSTRGRKRRKAAPPKKKRSMTVHT